MVRHDEKQNAPKKQDTSQQRRSPRANQDQYSGQEGTNPSGNQDQFSVDDVEGQYGSSRDQPGPFDSEQLYHKTSPQQPNSPRGQKQKQKRTDS